MCFCSLFLTISTSASSVNCVHTFAIYPIYQYHVDIYYSLANKFQDAIQCYCGDMNLYSQAKAHHWNYLFFLLLYTEKIVSIPWVKSEFIRRWWTLPHRLYIAFMAYASCHLTICASHMRCVYNWYARDVCGCENASKDYICHFMRHLTNKSRNNSIQKGQ